MAELRSVDPRTLQVNPNNPRRTPVPPAMDEQLARLDQGGRHHPAALRHREGRRAG